MHIVKDKIKLPVVNFENKKVGDVVLPGAVFGVEPDVFSVQLAVKVYLANRRQATAKTRTISEVKGTGKKPWRQKGTGRARVGTHRSPLWRGGAVVFGPTGIQNYKLSMNKKQHFLALASVLTDKANENKITVIETEEYSSAKTKDFVKTLETLKLEGKTLFVIDNFDENFLRACRNIPTVSVDPSDNLSVYDVLNANNLVFTKSVIDDINSQIVEEGEVKEAK